jgi:hypothetical protein
MKGTRVYFYVRNITKLVLSFQNALVFNFINNKHNVFIKKYNNRPTSKHLSYSICKWFFVKMSNLPHIYESGFNFSTSLLVLQQKHVLVRQMCDCKN